MFFCVWDIIMLLVIFDSDCVSKYRIWYIECIYIFGNQFFFIFLFLVYLFSFFFFFWISVMPFSSLCVSKLWSFSLFFKPFNRIFSFVFHIIAWNRYWYFMILHNICSFVSNVYHFFIWTFYNISFVMSFYGFSIS